MPNICLNCVEETSLKRLIEEYGIDDSECEICRISSKTIDAGNNSFQQLFKALIRFHYNEWEYNHHWGGDRFEEILSKKNPILNHKSINDEDGFQYVIDVATERPYENYDKGVTLYEGEGILRSIKSSSHPKFSEIEKRLQVENHFSVEPEMIQLLEKFKGAIDAAISDSTEFTRARIGFKNTKLPLDWGFEPEYHYEPYSKSEIAAPPPRLSSAGRVNRQGVSFFYAATNVETAIAEVRPHPGDLVSIGCFKTTKSLILADFTESRIEKFSLSDQLLDDFLIIHTVNTYLNKVVPPSERERYSVTQLIADTLRHLGYDGIKFISTVGSGHNVVFFEPNIMEFIPGKSAVFEVKQLSYDLVPKKVIDDSSEYFEM